MEDKILSPEERMRLFGPGSVLTVEELRSYSAALVKGVSTLERATKAVEDANCACRYILEFVLFHVAMWGEDPRVVGDEASLLLTLKKNIEDSTLSEGSKAWARVAVDSARMSWKLFARDVSAFQSGGPVRKQ